MNDKETMILFLVRSATIAVILIVCLLLLHFAQWYGMTLTGGLVFTSIPLLFMLKAAGILK